MTNELTTFPSLEKLSHAATKRIIEIANEAIKARGIFRIALAGGSTPKKLYEALASSAYKDRTEWEAWAVYFSDERIVSPGDERSNYATAKETLLTHVAIPKENIYAPPVTLNDPAAIALEYERTIRRNTNTQNGVPRFDLILLGLGSDGHTASLFPGKPALKVTDRLVVESTPGVLPPPVNRITFTFPLINAAGHVMFLAGGTEKVDAFAAAQKGTLLNGEQIPAFFVQPANGMLWWFVTSDLL